MSHSDRGEARLVRSLQMLAEIEARSDVSPHIEAAVMARWDRRHAPRTRSRTRRVVRAAATVAAGITIVGAVLWQRATDEPARAPRYTTVAVVGGPLMADEPIRVVRMRVARSVLGELGIPSPSPREVRLKPDTTTETVDIDVLVGEDGVARGVRVPIREL